MNRARWIAGRTTSLCLDGMKRKDALAQARADYDERVNQK